MQLPLPLPDLFVSADQVRSGVQAMPIEVDPRYQVRATALDMPAWRCPLLC